MTLCITEADQLAYVTVRTYLAKTTPADLIAAAIIRRMLAPTAASSVTN